MKRQALRSVATRHLLSISLATFGLAACGGATHEVRTAPDESRDVSVIHEERTVATGRAPVGQDFVGSHWKWVEASCTEGPLDLTSRGFEDDLHVELRGVGYLLVHDQTMSATCKRTVYQSATPTETGDYTMEDENVVGQPSVPECEGQLEQVRPGEVRMHGQFLEVLVQRSRWCNGFEVRMVYAPQPRTPIAAEETIRRYVLDFNRKDISRIAHLFAEDGSLLENFTINEDGTPTRHDGRDAVIAWYTQAIGSVPWVGLHLKSVEAGNEEGQFVLKWDYMDPRLSEPFSGTNTFTIAAGEILETQIAVDHPAADPTPAHAAHAATPAAHGAADAHPADAHETSAHGAGHGQRGNARPAARRPAATAPATTH